MKPFYWIFAAIFIFFDFYILTPQVMNIPSFSLTLAVVYILTILVSVWISLEILNSLLTESKEIRQLKISIFSCFEIDTKNYESQKLKFYKAFKKVQINKIKQILKRRNFKTKMLSYAYICKNIESKSLFKNKNLTLKDKFRIRHMYSQTLSKKIFNQIWREFKTGELISLKKSYTYIIPLIISFILSVVGVFMGLDDALKMVQIIQLFKIVFINLLLSSIIYFVCFPAYKEEIQNLLDLKKLALNI